MLKFNTSCAVLAYLSSNLLNEVGLSLFRYFEVGLRVCDIVVKKFTFVISSPDEFLYNEEKVKPVFVFIIIIITRTISSILESEATFYNSRLILPLFWIMD